MKASLLLLLLLVGVNFSARAQSDKLIKTQAYKAYSRSGLEKLRSGDSDGAIADFTEAIKVAPAAGDEALAGSYVNRSVPFQSKGDLDAALADVNKAIKIQPRSFVIYRNRGLLFEKRKELDKALADYTKAIKISSELLSYLPPTMRGPQFAPAYLSRGLLLLARGNDAEAEKDFAKGIELDPASKPRLEKKIQEVKEKRPAKP